MLVRVGGGSAGIKDYLENGQKAGRDFTRDELDERVIIAGDLEHTDTIINDMDKEGERYLHITMSFKEDDISPETLKEITEDFRQFAMTAYDQDEYNFYAEAHLPKIKSYTDQRTGEMKERKPHIHVVIPEKNLLTGKNMNPFGKVDQQTKFLEAFQEKTNNKYGLASPKDNRRIQFTDESTMISRYKGDLFKGANHELREKLLSEVMERRISDYGKFRELVAEQGAVKTRNAGKDGEYLNVKPEGQAKGVNLKDYVFSRAFIEASEAEKRRHLASEIKHEYEAAKSPRPSPKELEARLGEWHSTRARELKHINSGNRKLYGEYRAADPERRQAILAEREAKFTDTYRRNPEHEREHRAGRAADRIRDNLDAAGRNIAATGRAVGDSEQARRNLADRRAGRAIAALGERLGLHQGQDAGARSTTRPERDLGARGSDSGRRPVSALDQVAKEHREGKAQAKDRAEMDKIKRELDGARLLAHVSKTHGVIPEKYQVTKGKDGADRIQCGRRQLNVTDFATKEMNLPWKEARQLLRDAYKAQHGRAPIEKAQSPKQALWEDYRANWRPQRAEQKAQEWATQRESEKARRAELRERWQAERRTLQAAGRDLAPADRKAAQSLATMAKVQRDMELREAIKTERDALKEKYAGKPADQYRAYLAEKASDGNEAALAELRRQRAVQVEADNHPRTIQERQAEKDKDQDAGRKKDDQDKAPILRGMSYTVDKDGNVTYYDAKKEAVLVDRGEKIAVEKQERAAVETALRLAMQKYGDSLKLNGTDEFKRQAVEASVRAGLKIDFNDNDLNRYAKELEDQRQAGREYMAQQRDGAGRPDADKTPKPEPEREQAERDRQRQAERENDGPEHGL